MSETIYSSRTKFRPKKIFTRRVKKVIGWAKLLSFNLGPEFVKKIFINKQYIYRIDRISYRIVKFY